MATIQQAVCYPILGDVMPLEKLFPELKKIGFAGVEMWEPTANFEDICRLALDCGLRVVGMVASAAPLTERRCHEKAVHDLLGRIDQAAAKGIGSLTVLSGNRNPGLSDDAAVSVVCEALSRVLGHADKAKVTLNLELLNSKVDHKGYQADHTAWGLAVLRRLRSSRLKLLYDIYHMQIMEGDVIRTIQANIDQIGHFHTGGVPGRAELDDSQELNYRAICRAIAATGYSGYISHEFRPRGDTLAGLRQAYEICNVP